jgi:alpha-amylase
VRSPGIKTAEGFYGGTLKGVTHHLDYIANLGCTAIWLPPVLENNPRSYHGYDVSNYLDVDRHFGTKEDLAELVEVAHGRRMRVILDVVVNHSGDNWSYPGGHRYHYSHDRRFPFGFWRRGDRPIPVELRNPQFYHRRGEITTEGWDRYPENQHGDILGLKDYHNDDDQIGAEVIDILSHCYCYWIRETDVDGFRVDAAKHMGELACCRFCSNIREYAYSLGKRGFFLFGEVASPSDEIYDRYIGQNTSRQDDGKTVFFGLNSVLDFRLAQGARPGKEPLRDVIKGLADPHTLFNRLEAQRQRAFSRGEIGRYLVTFVDNHDSFWQPSGRIANGATDRQVIAAIGYLLCSLGTACIYYGTEQGFSGHGADNDIREAMFHNEARGGDLLNSVCEIYRRIAAIARVRKENPCLRFGSMYYREVSDEGLHFALPHGANYTLAFSRILYSREVLIAYNVSTERRCDRITVDSSIQTKGKEMHFLYGGDGVVEVEKHPDNPRLFVQFELEPHQFVILE